MDKFSSEEAYIFLVIREILHLVFNLMIHNSVYKSSSLKQIPHFPLLVVQLIL